jgi:hypothetical protein
MTKTPDLAAIAARIRARDRCRLRFRQRRKHVRAAQAAAEPRACNLYSIMRLAWWWSYMRKV